MVKPSYYDLDPTTELSPFQDQDLRLLKAITSDQRLALDFVNTNDSSLFIGSSRAVGQVVCDYIRAYKTIPTKRVLIDKHQSNNILVNQIESLFDNLQLTNFDSKEYQYDLEKIKQRYVDTKFNSLKDDLRFHDKGVDSDTLNKIENVFKEIKRVQQPSRSSYLQKSIDEYLSEFHEEYVAKIENPSLGQGILSGYSYFDYVTNGLSPAELLIVGAETGAGKALPLDTLIPTPNGMKLMRDIHPGDIVFGRDGNTCTVLAESELFNSFGWKFIFNDGTEIISHDNHEWLTFNRKEQLSVSRLTDVSRAKRKIQRKSRAVKSTKPWLIESNKNRKCDLKTQSTGGIRTTQEIVNTLRVQSVQRANHAIPLCGSLQLPHKDLVLDPYVLGLWLGDGTARKDQITTADDELLLFLEKLGYKIKTRIAKKEISLASTYSFETLRAKLKIIRVLKNKHIPQDYLWASEEQRLSLLQGLMDSDSTINIKGNSSFSNTNKNLADGVAFLVRSLGERASIVESLAKLNGKITGPVWNVFMTPRSHEIFKRSRKKDRQMAAVKRLNKFKYIHDAIRTEKTLMKCIQVSSPDNMYLAGEHLTPTHNSMLLNNMAIQMWMQKNTIGTDPSAYTRGYNILYFSLEMPYKGCFRRTLARLADVPTYGLRDSRLTKSETESVNLASRFIKKFSATQAKFEIVDIPRGVTVEQIEERYLEARTRFIPDVVVVDYLGLLEDPNAEGDDWLKLGYIAGKLHEFGRAYNTRIMSAVQLNRPAKSSKNADPSELIGIHRIGRSSLIMHHANVGIQIESRKDENTRDTLVYHIIKNRDGELGKHEIRKKFANAAIFDTPYIPPDRDEFGSFISGFDDEEDISAQVRKMLFG